VSTATLKLLFNLLALGTAFALALAMAASAGSRATEVPWTSLAQGRAIAQEDGFPSKDPFFATPDAPQGAAFDKDGWLFGLALFGLHQIAPMRALQGLRAGLILASFLFMVAAAFRRGARPFSSAWFSLWAAMAVLPLSPLGPALAGLALFACCLWLMEGDFWPAFFGRWVWLPGLVLVWVNFQATAWFMLPVAAAWALSERRAEAPEAPQFPALAITGTLGAVAVCLFLHPALWRTPLLALPSLPNSPFVPSSFDACKGALALLGVALLAYLACVALPQGREHARRDGLLLLSLILPSMLWKSCLPFACALAAPLAASRADIVVDAMPAALRNLRWVVKAAALVLGLCALPSLYASSLHAAAPQSQPKETVQFFRDELMDGNAACDMGWAGRLLWELSPSLRICWGGLDQELPSEADFAWLRVNSPLAKSLSLSRDWQPVDFDDASVLYARVDAAHAALIKTWAPHGLRPGDLDEPFESSRLPQVEADLEGRRLNRPASGILHYFEAKLALDKGQEVLARQWLEQGIQADPGFAPNYRLLAELRMKLGDKKGAQAFFERAAALGGL
jgi:hypothetical protein